MQHDKGEVVIVVCMLGHKTSADSLFRGLEHVGIGSDDRYITVATSPAFTLNELAL